MNAQAEKKDPVDLVKAESKYGGYVTKENPVVSAQFAIKLAIQIDELNNQLAKFKENAGVYRTRIINAIHMLDAGHTKKQVRLHLSGAADQVNADQLADAVVVPLDLIKRIDDALGAFTGGDEELLNSHIDTYNDVREIRAAQEGK